jgi:hypothetical protein
MLVVSLAHSDIARRQSGKKEAARQPPQPIEVILT